jgi:hypothetical protein
VAVDAERDEVASAQRHVGIQRELLRHVADLRVAARARGTGDEHAPGDGRAPGEPEDHPEQGRLAGAV